MKIQRILWRVDAETGKGPKSVKVYASCEQYARVKAERLLATMYCDFRITAVVILKS